MEQKVQAKDGMEGSPFLCMLDDYNVVYCAVVHLQAGNWKSAEGTIMLHLCHVAARDSASLAS